MLAYEKVNNIFPSIDSIFKEREEMGRYNDKNLGYKYFCELNDEKMLYMLCQNSLFNRQYIPFSFV